MILELKEIGIESLYHAQHKEEQGEEMIPTFYLHRKVGKPYHIDYAFLSSDLIEKGRLIVGSKSDWLTSSDHMPLIVTLES